MTIRATSLTCLFAVVCGAAVPAQSSRYDWKQWSVLDLDKLLTYTLQDTPLTNSERQQIYKQIDNEYVHDSFTDAQRDEEREAVMSARVGSIALADDGSQQVLVQGPRFFCGATGNCSYWVFIRQNGQLRLVLAAGGSLIRVRNASRHGFCDVATFWHLSAYDSESRVYHWDGSKYEQADCFISKLNRDDPDKAPIIAGCAEGPQH